ncbi:galactokinase [Sphingorhabdus sp.]|uniref:galactokinase n=1 Tax=Sphingorhabdus sp. TaxID=1902408 RepID=UPI0032B76475
MTDNQALIDKAVTGYRASFGTEPDLVAYAPGRVNLIGEHTDYNGGFVLPCAIPYGTAIAMGRSNAPEISAVALDLDNATDHFAIGGDAITPLGLGEWENHLRGIVAGSLAFGLPVHGANMAITGNVPQGAGLSSSASLGIAMALGLSALVGQDDPDRTKLARIAQWAEHEFVGCSCGLMDQLASAYGEADHALLIDCGKVKNQTVPMPDGARILIIHSGVKRGLVDSAYNERRMQCEAAARHYGVAELRDLDETRLISDRNGLDETTFRRARHVVTENVRTLEMAEALAIGDYAAIGRLMRASHQSMRDDFEITLPEIDSLVENIARSLGGEGGARMTGGGFGGCVVAICLEGKIDAVYDGLSAYWEKVGRESPLQTVITPAQGATVIHL